MDKIIIDGIAGYNGEYEFDAGYFTNEELHTIKRVAGVRAGELQDALAAMDSDLVVAFAAVALKRNGKAVHEQLLWAANFGAIRLEFDAEVPEEDAELPPPQGPGDSESEDENRPSSGPTSNGDSDPPENGQSRTGLHPSELSAA